jgi:hypothetical protein
MFLKSMFFRIQVMASCKGTQQAWASTLKIQISSDVLEDSYSSWSSTSVENFILLEHMVHISPFEVPLLPFLGVQQCHHTWLQEFQFIFGLLATLEASVADALLATFFLGDIFEPMKKNMEKGLV